MNEIKCPKCGTVFQISESDYESILKRVRNKELEKEINLREEQFKKEKESEIKLVEAKLEKVLTENLNKKEIELNELKNELKNKEEQVQNKIEKEYKELVNKREVEILDKVYNIYGNKYYKYISIDPFYRLRDTIEISDEDLPF